jgi:putative FmdB family regulatory protein
MPLYDLKCNGCEREWVRYSKVDDRTRPCEECGGDVTQLFKAPAVISVDIRHGLCNEDGSPRRFYSKSEIAKEAAKRGLVNLVRHVPERGSDKSKHTSRWV